MTTLPKQFEIYLRQELTVSGKTLRNYRADLGHFLRWSKEHLASQGIAIEDLESLLPHFSGFLVASYRTHQVKNNIPQGTTNRRLSTLRNFGKFLKHTGIADYNPAQLITNLKEEPTLEQQLEETVSEYTKHLEKEKISKVTIKNYLSDVRHFVAWLSKQEGWIKEQEIQSDRNSV